MNTLKKLAVAVGLMAGLCSYAQPVPIKISSLVPVTNAQPNALVLLTIPGVTNYVITIANLQMQIGGGSTNFALTAATDLTNLIYIVGANDTNYINSIFTSLSNLINSSGVNVTNLIYLIGANATNFTYQIGANTTNFVIATGTSLSNLIYQIGANCTNFTYAIGSNLTNFVYAIGGNVTNYVDQAASNRVAVAQGTNTVVVTNNIGSTMVFTVSSVPTAAPFPGGTNRTVTIATNAGSVTLDFLGAKDWYECPVYMQTNLVLSPTNLMGGREIWVFFTGSNGNYDVAVTNTAGDAIHWNLNGATNGSTAFTVTNGANAELCITCRSNNILHAVYGQYR